MAVWMRLAPPAIPGPNDMKFASGAPGYRFVLDDLLGGTNHPVRYVEFRLYRHFGFAIWDYKRMEGLSSVSSARRSSDAP